MRSPHAARGEAGPAPTSVLPEAPPPTRAALERAFLEEAQARARVKRPAPEPAAVPPDGSQALLLPAFAHLEAKERSFRETYLYRLGGQHSTAAAAKRLCAELLPPSAVQPAHEQYVQRQLDRAVEQFKDTASAERVPALATVKVSATLSVDPDRVYMDEFLWDLGSPKAALDLYAAAVCSALRLPYPCYVIISRKLRERVDKLRQEQAAGTLATPAPASLVRATPSNFPAVVRPSKEIMEALRARHASRHPADAAAGGAGPDDKLEAASPPEAEAAAAEVAAVAGGTAAAGSGVAG